MPKKSRGVPKDFNKFKKALAEKIGSRIRDRRLELNLSQRALREKMELEGVYVTRSQFSRIESGQRLPVASEIIALAAVLKVSCDWLLLGQKKDKE